MLKFQGGAQQICDKIIQKIERKNVLTNQVVLEIERTENDVIVVTDNGTFRLVYTFIQVLHFALNVGWLLACIFVNTKKKM